jgi:hypothetical protein
MMIKLIVFLFILVFSSSCGHFDPEGRVIFLGKVKCLCAGSYLFPSAFDKDLDLIKGFSEEYPGSRFADDADFFFLTQTEEIIMSSDEDIADKIHLKRVRKWEDFCNKHPNQHLEEETVAVLLAAEWPQRNLIGYELVLNFEQFGYFVGKSDWAGQIEMAIKIHNLLDENDEYQNMLKKKYEDFLRKKGGLGQGKGSERGQSDILIFSGEE